jgi:hypothetical protein
MRTHRGGGHRGGTERALRNTPDPPQHGYRNAIWLLPLRLFCFLGPVGITPA